jgi:RNA-directed DNA polymerase
MNTNPQNTKLIERKIQGWTDINWQECQNRNRQLQGRIFKKGLQLKTLIESNASATEIKNTRNAMHSLQLRLIKTYDARLLAVKQVCQVNKGRKTPGYDKQLHLTNTNRLQLAKELSNPAKAEPIRVVEIDKPGKTEKRKLGIPVMRDRALQCLYKFALEPAWEAQFETESYGFRPGRSAHDAIGAIFSYLRGSRKWVLDADISKCFDQIDHAKLLAKLDPPKSMVPMIKGWLEAGKVKGFPNLSEEDLTHLEKTPMGTPQGGIISPFLANVALHGMENDLRDYYVNELYGQYVGVSSTAIRERRRQIGFVRYADDFVILHNEEDVIKRCKTFVDKWLKENAGLSISEEKTRIVDSALGFNFLGFHIITVRNKLTNKYKCHITPSRNSRKAFKDKVRRVFRLLKVAKTDLLISKLAPIIVGWCNYFRYCECTEAFKELDLFLWERIEVWINRKQSGSVHQWKEKYFPIKKVMFQGHTHKGNWILSIYGPPARGTKQPSVKFLPYPSWVTKKEHIKVKGDVSPYNGNDPYWAQRSAGRYCMWNATTLNMIKKQGMKCAICGEYFINSADPPEKDHIIPVADGGKTTRSNLQVVHQSCHRQKSKAENKKTSSFKSRNAT